MAEMSYKEIKTKAERYMIIHRSACEEWTHGKMKQFRADVNGVISISYEDGTWFHYREDGAELHWK